MSQIVLDDQLFDLEVLIPIARWITVQRLRDLRPGEVIKDERVPVLLKQLRQPTFVTIDMGFWNRGLRDAHYCVLCFPLANEEQYKLPQMLRALLRLSEFRTKAVRMGKVARVRPGQIDYWQLGEEQLHRLTWPDRFD
ncbi:MAG: hypothetical protein L0332_05025 [Chloroflexi bacterium]|nr:hypothetical protein [Chloroflexota bacterium]MCI0577850.1 hypothetical protein [Chloroflexota bacterium]MCI0643832.1 hypothetical protein [Chloroflexota bacterium]MCI0726070.1 hypothetical protein [Chloroflexota bacterium]